MSDAVYHVTMLTDLSDGINVDRWLTVSAAASRPWRPPSVTNSRTGCSTSAENSPKRWECDVRQVREKVGVTSDKW